MLRAEARRCIGIRVDLWRLARAPDISAGVVTFDDLRAMVLALPDTEETTSWDSRSFKVNGKVILYWNASHDCPVFKVDSRSATS